MHAQKIVAATCAAVLLGGIACGADRPSTASAVRDSAGVTIVDVAAPTLDGAASWRISDRPILEIGSPDGASGTALFRVNSVARLSDGRIVAVDGGSEELRFFSPTGEYLRSVGGRGSGPGEFEAMSNLRVLPGDTLLVKELLGARVTLFDPAGGLVRTMRFEPPSPGGGFRVLGRLADGSYLTRGGRNPMYLDVGTGRKWSAAWVTRLDAEGHALGNVLEFPGTEGIVAGGVAGVASMGAPFHHRNITLLAGDRLVLAGSERYELKYFGLDGTLRRVVRPGHEPRPVTATDIDAYRDRFLEARSDDPGRARELLGILEFPETFPTFEDAISDRLGNVWVQAYRPSDATGPLRWSVFGPEGERVTDVETPESYRVMEIGADYVLGVWRDELRVEYVRMYSLVKDGGVAS